MKCIAGLLLALLVFSNTSFAQEIPAPQDPKDIRIGELELLVEDFSNLSNELFFANLELANKLKAISEETVRLRTQIAQLKPPKESFFKRHRWVLAAVTFGTIAIFK